MSNYGKFQLETILCRGGCGKTLTTTIRSLYGLDELHNQFAGYCENCLPISENELIRLQGEGLAKSFSLKQS